ncbi:hypothetical protein [Crenothrix polyspora]|uniref:Mor transcription activator domain-containing protein n=1 Tax=Crenothrix polyspora TaxID=360316 RepID=A0A1R4H158_9GAMM|nr:hypothetical protein [Crenothrix polyspora]SJM89983.1 hypothetical protein CRENPOLYSF1_1290009 [Crenothrix polyspora]
MSTRDDIIALIGDFDACIIFSQLGGTVVNLSLKNPKPRDINITPKSWYLLCAYFNHEAVYIPKCRRLRNEIIINERRQGRRIVELAQKFQLSFRQIIRICVKK